MALHLEEEPVFAEYAFKLDSLCFRVEVPAFEDQLGYFARQARGQRDKPVAVLPQKLHVNARPDVKPFGERDADEMAEVFIPCFVFAKQDKMVPVGVDVIIHVEPRTHGDIHLAADNRLDPGVFSFLIKIDGAIHNAVVRDSDAFLPELLDPRDKVAQPARAVKQAILAMDVQMHKRHRSHLHHE
jgi:hypothetical protein